MSARTPTPCGHVKLLARDFANQPRSFNGPCLICQRDALVAALEQIAPWLRGGDYDTRGGLIEMDRLAGVAEAALKSAKVSS